MNLQTRIKELEQKLITDNSNQPACVLIVQESGKLNGVVDDSAIIRYMFDNNNYDREPGENEEVFTMRAASLAKALLPSPQAVPCLFAVTENMIKTLARA